MPDQRPIRIVVRKKWFWSRWYWRMVGTNGQVLSTSEVYSSHQAAMDTANMVARATFVVVEQR